MFYGRHRENQEFEARLAWSSFCLDNDGQKAVKSELKSSCPSCCYCLGMALGAQHLKKTHGYSVLLLALLHLSQAIVRRLQADKVHVITLTSLKEGLFELPIQNKVMWAHSHCRRNKVTHLTVNRGSNTNGIYSSVH